jgi:hypothetical protein
MNESELTALLDRHGDRYRPTAGRLTGGPLIATVDWPDPNEMLDAYAVDHPDSVHVRLFVARPVQDPDVIAEMALREDPQTIWRHRTRTTPRATSPTPTAAPADSAAAPRGKGRPRRPIAELAAVAVEMRLLNGPTWPAGGVPRYGKTHLQRRYGWTVDQARDRLRETRHLIDTNPDFAATVNQLADQRRRQLAYQGAAAMIAHHLTDPTHTGDHLDIGAPLDQIAGLTDAITAAHTELTDTAAQLRSILGGPARQAIEAYATWRDTHPDTDVATLLDDAHNHAKALKAGTTKNYRTVRTWLAHHDPTPTEFSAS